MLVNWRNKMDNINFRIPKVILALIFISIFIIGCVQPINLGLIDVKRNVSVHEFDYNNYRMKVLIIPISDENDYVCSFSIFNKVANSPIKLIESHLNIRRYPKI